MLQFLAPVVGGLLGQLFMPKVQQPQTTGTGLDIAAGGFIPGATPMAPAVQNNFNLSSLLGGVLSIALGGGQASPFGLGGGFGGGFGGGLGGGLGMGNPFVAGNMLGGLGGFFNPSGALLGFNGSGPMFTKTMEATNKMVDTLNGEGGAQVADANINILDSAT